MSIDVNDALIIAEKLKAKKQSKKGRPHDLMQVYYKEKMIVQFGISRTSHRGKGHGHIPGNIYWSPHKCKECAKCNLGYDDWVKDMKERGVIAKE